MIFVSWKSVGLEDGVESGLFFLDVLIGDVLGFGEGAAERFFGAFAFFVETHFGFPGVELF